MTITLPKTCLTGLVAALLLPLALTACGSDDAATERVAAAEAAAKRAEDAAKRAEESAKAAKVASAGSIYGNEPAPLDVPIAPGQDDDAAPSQPNQGEVSDHVPPPPRTPA